MKDKKHIHCGSSKNSAYIFKIVEEMQFIYCSKLAIKVQTFFKQNLMGSYIIRILTYAYDIPFSDLKNFLTHAQNLISEYAIG